MRYDRIGELLGVSEGAVKVRVHRAMKELKAAFAKLGGGDLGGGFVKETS